MIQYLPFSQIYLVSGFTGGMVGGDGVTGGSVTGGSAVNYSIHISMTGALCKR